MRALAASVAICAACSAADDTMKVPDPPAPSLTTPQASSATQVTQATPQDDEELACGAGDEDVVEAREYLLGLSNCEAVCTGLLTAGCWAVAGACLVTEVFTLGGITIPCSVALPVACLGGTGGIAACFKLCD